MEPIYKGYFRDYINSKKTTVCTIILTDSEMKAVKKQALFEENELIHEGKLYDIIAISIHQNKYHFSCKFDKLEQGFTALVNEFVKAIHQNSMDNNTIEINSEKLNSYFTFTTIHLSKKQVLLYQLSDHFPYYFSSITFQASDKTPPPEVL